MAVLAGASVRALVDWVLSRRGGPSLAPGLLGLLVLWLGAGIFP